MKGLSKELVLELSKRKKEPKWVLEKRLLGLKYWDELKMPAWSPDLTGLMLSEIETYVRPV